MIYMITMEGYSAIKRNKGSIHNTTWITFENMKEASHHRSHIIFLNLYKISRIHKSIETDWESPGSMRRRDWRLNSIFPLRWGYHHKQYEMIVSGYVTIKLYLWTPIFDFEIFFKCHEIVIFCFVFLKI